MGFKMRRGFSILLALFFLLGPLAPMLQSSVDDSGLPACCRRHGAHHCAMAMETAQDTARAENSSAPALTAPLTCPLYPGPATLMVGTAPALAIAGARLRASIPYAFPPAIPRAVFVSRAAGTHAGRGPPSAI
jgi:hypothetical protein